jgi:uncharacterized cupin superfamily protein
MKLTRLFTGSDLQSHFQETEIELLDAPIGKITAGIKSGEIIFGEIEDVQEISWHNPPCKQYVIMLKGAMEIEVGDGTRRIFREGDILLSEDTTGQGHITRAASEGIRRYLVIPLS